MAGYRLVVNKRQGSRRPGAAKAAADRAPVARLSVHKGGRATAAGNRYSKYTVVREAPGQFRDCAACGEP
eukprot:5053236-Prymnesium_polylepis.1